ncbi:MAG: glycoside hydrolase family 3 protein, partial [Solirubrobacterales bacterium]|nr:glycoside hydrolase family 3 protein [Solirubrobacterales bacterium]
ASAGGQDGVLPYEDPSLPVAQRVDDLLGRMTLEEKVGQMTQTERQRVDGNEHLITDWKLGSILSGGGSTPATNTAAGWADMVDRMQDAALATRLHIPILYGVDSVHGHGNLLGATVFPHNIGMGATRDPDLVREAAHITAMETRASGPQWTFAPCLCAARDDRWGRTYESYSESPDLVIDMETSIDGFQGPPGHLSDPDRVLATAKHYAGDGDTEYGTAAGDYKIDQGIAVASHEQFFDTSLRQYVPAVQDHHVGSVMPSFSSVDWTDDDAGPLKMHAHKELITDVLKGEMGFDGFVISDWEAIHQIPGDLATQIRTSVNAGVDMFMEPDPGHFQDFITTLIGEVNGGRVTSARIDDAVRRILTAKFELGLFEHPKTDRTHIDEIGSAEHRAVARQAVAESQVLLKNKKQVLPIKPTARVYVAGSNADNIGNQAGGWTLTWQGGSKNVIPGQTILDGIKAATTGTVRYSEKAWLPINRHETGIVVVGETPYAEGFGDVGGPRWAYDPADMGVPRPVKNMQLSRDDRKAIDKVCTATVRCVVVVISGRPLVIDNDQLRKMEGLVAGWLPGSEGEGVADVLFGSRGFTGKLPMTWPRSLDQEPINVGDADYDPLYPFGFGLETTAWEGGS